MPVCPLAAGGARIRVVGAGMGNNGVRNVRLHGKRKGNGDLGHNHASDMG